MARYTITVDYDPTLPENVATERDEGFPDFLEAVLTEPQNWDNCPTFAWSIAKEA